MRNDFRDRLAMLTCENKRERCLPLSVRRACRGSMMMEYVILVTVMAIAVLFASSWLNTWDGGDAPQSFGNAQLEYAGVQFQQQQGIGPELKGMYQRIQAGIALPSP